MLEEKEIEVEGIKFVIGKFPAVAGREIITQYPTSGMPKIGDYKTNETLMLKVVSFADIVKDGGRINLANRTLIDNHIPSWETLVKLEWEIMSYNCSFFQNGKALNFFNLLSDLAGAKITEILTGLLGRLSQAEKQPLTSSEQSTPLKTP
jgi:hypothetical protein